MYGLADWQIAAIEAQALPRALDIGERIIYALIDPRDNSIRYVGQTKTPHKRLMQHMSQDYAQGAKKQWLDELTAARLVPIMQICERVQGAQKALLREAETIRRFISEGAMLVNGEAQEREHKRARRQQSAPVPITYTATYLDTVSFRGRPITLVRLSNGRAGVVLKTFCEALAINTSGQVRRIQGRAMLSIHLARAILDTPGGPQGVYILCDLGIPVWLATLDLERISTPYAAHIAAFQEHAIRALGIHAQQEGEQAFSRKQERQ